MNLINEKMNLFMEEYRRDPRKSLLANDDLFKLLCDYSLSCCGILNFDYSKEYYQTFHDGLFSESKNLSYICEEKALCQNRRAFELSMKEGFSFLEKDTKISIAANIITFKSLSKIFFVYFLLGGGVITINPFNKKTSEEIKHMFEMKILF